MIQEYTLLQNELKQLLRKRETAVIRVQENKEKHLQAQEIFKKEQADVDKLENQTLSSFVHSILGNFEKKLDKEKQEMVAAKIELDTAAALHLDAIEDLEKIDDEIKALKAEMTALQATLRASDPAFNEKIAQQERELLLLKQEEKELNEAIRAGENVLQVIDHVLSELDSADSMATWDMFTDSFFIDLMKYNKIDEAERRLTRLERALDRYQKELKDVDLQTSIAYEEIGQMNRAFDIFFDNIFSDWNTKNKIQRNIQMIEDMLYEVEDVQELLYERENSVKYRIKTLEGIL